MRLSAGKDWSNSVVMTRVLVMFCVFCSLFFLFLVSVDQGWRREEESEEMRQVIRDTKTGEFASMHAWSLMAQEEFDPQIHEIGVNWPPPVRPECCFLCA